MRRADPGWTPTATVLAILGSMLALLVPALWNGFPFTFFDSGAFIEQAIDHEFRPERSVFYTWFLMATQFATSLWLPVVVQAAMTVLVLLQAARVLAPSLAPGRFGLVVLALVVGTGLPWYAAQIEPDILGPLMVLALYLLGFHADALSRPRRLALAGVIVLAATAHGSHLVLLAGLALATWLARLLWPTQRAPRPRPGAAFLALALSIGLIVASNYARTGELFLSRAGSAFVFARLVEDGIVKRLLDDTCPQAGYRLCARMADLPRTADDWLWHEKTPFWDFGGFEGTAEESKRMILDSLARYPLLHAEAALRATASQFVRFRTGDGIVPQPWPVRYILEHFLPGQLAPFAASRQQQGQIGFTWLNRLHVPVGAASLAAAAVLIGVALARRRWDRVALPGFLMLALIGNAMICGVLSTPHDRYQSRLIWMLCFGLLLVLAERHAAARSG